MIVKKTVGVVGLGRMGGAIATTLSRANFAVIGTDLSVERRLAAARDGITVYDNVPSVCAAADIVLLSLPSIAAIEQVISGPNGIMRAGRTGLVVIDTSTSHPQATRSLASQLTAAGIGLIDAPVSGGPNGARAGTLTIFIGGRDRDIAAAWPLFEALGRKLVHLGPAGAGHAAKLINNLLCAAHLATTREAVQLGARCGLSPDKLIAAVNAGSGRSGVSEVNFPTWILNGSFDSGFTMGLMRKDVRLAADLVGTIGLDLPLCGEIARIWSESEAALGDDDDFNRIAMLPEIFGQSAL